MSTIPTRIEISQFPKRFWMRFIPDIRDVNPRDFGEV